MRRATSAAIVTVLAVMALMWSASARGQCVLKNDDRLVVIGDSLTEGGVYTRYVANYLTLHYPGMKVHVRNTGIGGETAEGAARRLQSYVLNFNPTFVSIQYGMNDPNDPPKYPGHMKALAAVVEELRKRNVQPIILSATIMDVDRNPPDQQEWAKKYNEALGGLAKVQCEYAKANDLRCFDLYTLMAQVHAAGKQQDPKFSLMLDNRHPAPRGHVLMAYGLLKALGCNEQASGLMIDVATKKATPDRCTVNDLQMAEGSITFTRTDQSLPTFFDEEARGIFTLFSSFDELNRYPLKVTGLKSGTWKLTVQDIEVGTFPAENLAKGVDLSTAPGPWRTLGEQVNEKSNRQMTANYERFYKYAYANPTSVTQAQPAFQALLKALDDAADTLEAERYALLAQRTWTWKLEQVK